MYEELRTEEMLSIYYIRTKDSEAALHTEEMFSIYNISAKETKDRNSVKNDVIEKHRQYALGQLITIVV